MPPRTRTVRSGLAALWFVIAVWLLGVPSRAQTAPDSPSTQSKTASKKLSDADAKRVNTMENTIHGLRRDGKIDAAIASAQDILAICEQTLGPGHWQTGDARRRVETLKHVAGLPEEGKKAMADTMVVDDALNSSDERRRQAVTEKAVRNLLEAQCRWLGEDRAETASTYNALSLSFRTKGNDAQLKLIQRALEIRLKVLEEGHPEVAQSYLNLAINLNQHGRYTDAEKAFRNALHISLKSLGEDDAVTAVCYIGLATSYGALGQLSKAEALLRKALFICRKALGDDHSLTLTCYNNLATNLWSQGRYAESREFLNDKTLALSIKKHGYNSLSTAQAYTNLATVIETEGRLSEAEPLHRKAVGICLRALGEDHTTTADCYNGLGVNLYSQGKPTEASLFFRKALDIRLKRLGESHEASATSYNNLAAVLEEMNRPEEAEALYRKALAVWEKSLAENHPRVALAHINIANLLDSRGNHARAEPHHRTAMKIYLIAFGEGLPETGLCSNNLGANLKAQRRYAEADPFLRKALSIMQRSKGENHPDTATCYSNLAFNCHALGLLEESIRYWTAASDISERVRFRASATGLERALKSQPSPDAAFAMTLATLGRPLDGWTRWEASLAKGLLDDLSARQLRPFTLEERQRESEILDKLQHVEEQVSRLIGSQPRTEADDHRLEALRGQQGTLRGQFIQFKTELDARYQTFSSNPLDIERIQAVIPSDSVLVGWLDVPPLHWACLVQKSGNPSWVKIRGTGKDDSWTNDDDERPGTLRTALTNRHPDWLQVAKTLARQRIGPLRPHLNRVKHLVVLPSPALAGVPIEVLVAAQPADAPRLTVSYAPSGTIFARLAQTRSTPAGPPRLLALGDPAYPPAEPEKTPPPPPAHGLVLLDVQPNGVADLAGLKTDDVLLDYNGTALKAAGDLKTVSPEAGAKRIPVKFWRHGEVRTGEVAAGKLGIQLDATRTAAQVLLAQRAAEEVLKPLTRGAAWERLPGTQCEVNAIAALFPKERVTTLLEKQATESALQRMAQTGELKTYRLLHFATHGKANPNVAMSSALILAPDPDRSADSLALDTDGQITAQQIVNTWDLDADLVVLSACETGLGRYAGGEGYLGFTQALFVKGARSVVLSLWKVDDRATSLLMRRFYENLLGKREDGKAPMPKAEALSEAKAWLRTQSAEDDPTTRSEPRKSFKGKHQPAISRFDHPYYWAGFILIGDPN